MQKVKLSSQDGVIFEIDKDVAEMSNFISSIMIGKKQKNT